LIEGVDSSQSESQPRSHEEDENNPSRSDLETETRRRMWSWNNPKNNIDHTNLITPVVKKKSTPFPDRQMKVFPSFNHSLASNASLVRKDSHLVVAKGEELPSSCCNNELGPPSFRPSLRILIVDDATSIRRILDRALTAQGHSCSTASNGQECIDLITKRSTQQSSAASFSAIEMVTPRACHFDLILMDSEMPIMNGPTATKIIRSMGFQQLIIFGVTGNVLPDDVNMFLSHGVDAVIGKPMNIERMWQEYDRIVKDKLQNNFPLKESVL
jgi:CheY-like chemotaxis protein